MGEEVPAAEDLDTRSAFVRNTAVMSAGTALSRVTGFLRIAAMAYALGITESRLADAYNVANTTPNIIYELALGGILSSVFVPVFVEWLQTRGKDEAWDVGRRVLTIALIALSAIMAITIVAAPWIVRLYTSGVEDPAQRAAMRELATFFLRWFMPQIVFYGIGAVATGLLNAHRRFAAPMFAPILNNLIVIGTFLTYTLMRGSGAASPGAITTPQKLVLAIGTTLGIVAMTVALWPSLRHTGFRWRWRSGWRHEAVRRIARLATWAIVYVVVNQLSYLVVLVLAGRETGGYTAYTAAFILFQLPHAIFAVSIFTALLPAMSARWADRDPDGFREQLTQGIRATAIIVVPAAFGYLVLARPIVRLLLQHGVTTAGSTKLVASVLVFFAIGLFSFSAFQLLLRAFYSMQDTRTPALINVAASVLNVGVNIVLFGLMGVRGLALGYAISYTFAAVASAAIIRRRLGHLEGRRIAGALSGILPAAGLTAAAAWAAARGLEAAFGIASIATQAIQVLGAVFAGLLVFAAASLIFRLEEVDAVRRHMAARFKR